MTYLFWAFAVVWLGVFIYLYGLMRRIRALGRQVTELVDHARYAAGSGSSPAAGATGASPSARARTASSVRTPGAGG